MIRDFPNLIDCVQRNGHIADARHARDMTMCNYLLEMRDYYRWEHDLAPEQPAPRAEIGRWLSEREALWDTLADESYVDLPLGGGHRNPFDIEAINDLLRPQGLVYGAGYGRFGKPHFFLAKLLSEEAREGVRVQVCGCEYARDSTAIPAASQGDAIIVRQESLRQWLAQKTEAWEMRRHDGAMNLALSAYGIIAGAPAGKALAAMVEAETETLILHELGEHQAGRVLGPQWEEMLAGLTHRHAEIFARAVRDHWADCLTTLPKLLDRRAEGALHFWFANFDGLRRELFPLLGAAYATWRESGDAKQLRAAVARGSEHWRAAAERILGMWRRDGATAVEEMLRVREVL